MAFDEALAQRIRDLLEGEPGLREQRMFGGLAFLIGGHMAVAASGQGGLLVRVEPAEFDALIETANVRPMEMRGRAMRGWLRVDAAEVNEDEALARWVRRGAGYARSRPPKAPEAQTR
jgi:hypothetical protein